MFSTEIERLEREYPDGHSKDHPLAQRWQEFNMRVWVTGSEPPQITVGLLDIHDELADIVIKVSKATRPVDYYIQRTVPVSQLHGLKAAPREQN